MDIKSKFSKLFQENCTALTSEGEKLFAPLKQALADLFNSEEVRGMSETQKRIMGSVLSNIVGNHVSDSIREHTELVNMYSAMSDEDFENYLKEKYGKGWLLKSLTPEEFARSRPIAKANVDKIMEEIRKKMPKQPPYMPISRPFRR